MTRKQGVMTMNDKLAGNLKQAREKEGMSLEMLATIANVGELYLIELEDGGNKTPGADTLYRIAVALNTTIADLYGLPVRVQKGKYPAFEKHFAGIFMDALNDAAKVYERHIPEKQESWMIKGVGELWGNWLEGTGEVMRLLGGKCNPIRARRELLDMINVSLMVIKLIDEAKGGDVGG